MMLSPFCSQKTQPEDCGSVLAMLQNLWNRLRLNLRAVRLAMSGIWMLKNKELMIK